MIQSELNDLEKMNSQILLKINNFVKNRLIELLGSLLIVVSIFLLLSITTYSGGQENFIFKPENFDMDYKNFGGFYGSASSDFLLQSIGLVSFLFVLNLSFWGFKIITKKKIHNFITKIFYTLIYLVSGSVFLNIAFPFSHWLSDHGNGGFVGQSIKEFIYYFFPFIENKYIAYILILLGAYETILETLKEVSEKTVQTQSNIMDNMSSMQTKSMDTMFSIGQMLPSFMNWGAYKTTISSNGRISIPEAERNALDLGEGDLVQVIILPITKKTKTKKSKK